LNIWKNRGKSTKEV